MSKEEQTAFVQTFGPSPLIKVLDFFLTYREFDYPMTEIAENTGVGWNTLNTLIPKMLEKRLVVVTRKVGRATLYKLNQKNPVVQRLVEIDNIITSKTADEEMKQQEIYTDL